ncbi:MAG: diguanylate cyclase [Bacilli bacterium]|jgi:diguanylate cyclase (GGDEF)-like protein|nr:diguanylate cyclase [Bacilli bacterium]
MNSVELVWKIMPNLFGIVLSSMVLFYFSARRFIVSANHWAFRLSLWTLILLMASDVGIVCCSGRGSLFCYYAAIVFSVLYFVFQALLLYFWVVFMLQEAGQVFTFRFLVLAGIPVFLVMAFSLTSAFVPGLVFSVDPVTCAYSRGGWGWWTTAALTYPYYVLLWVVLFRFRKRLGREKAIACVVCFVFPMICNVVQIVFPWLLITWPSASISLLGLFLIAVVQKTQFDPLTGLYNRMQLEDYLQTLSRVRPQRRSQWLIGCMLDLNHFKEINDNYGHRVGDQALQEAAEILRNCRVPNEFFARYAGDEFVIVITSDDPNVQVEFKKRLLEKEREFKKSNSRPYELHFAFGFFRMEWKQTLDVPAFLERIDREMYVNKRLQEENSIKEAK